MPRHTLIPQMTIKIGVMLIEMIADLFQNRLRIGPENRVLAAADLLLRRGES